MATMTDRVHKALDDFRTGTITRPLIDMSKG